jgi:hypothetical protein
MTEFEELKSTWLEKVKTTKNENIYETYGFFTIHTDLHYAPDNIKEDWDVSMTACLEGKELLWNIHTKFRENPNFINHLIDNNYANDIYPHLGTNLKEDPVFFEKCMMRNESLNHLRHNGIPKNILEDKALILKVFPFKNFYTQLEKTYKLDKDILSIYLLEHNPSGYKTIQKRMYNYFSNRKDFIKQLIEKDQDLFSHIPINLQHDLDLIHIALSKGAYNIRLMPEDLLNDKSFMTYAMEKYKCDLKYCSKELKNDYDLAKINVTEDGTRLKQSPMWATDVGMAELALRTCSDINILPPELLKNKDLVIQFLEKDLKNCDRLRSLTKDYKEDYDIVKLNIKHNPLLLKESVKWKDNSELSALAFETLNDIQLLSKELLHDKQIILNLIKNDRSNCEKLFALTTEYKNDYDIMTLCIAFDGNLITHSPVFQADKDMVKIGLNSKKLINISNIDPALLFDKEIVTLFLEKNVYNFGLLPLTLKNDTDIALACIDSTIQSKAIYDMIINKSQMSDNKEFHMAAIEKNPYIYNFMEKTSPLKIDLDIVLNFVTHTAEDNPQIPDAITKKYNTQSAMGIKAAINYELISSKIPNKEVEPESKKKIKI